MINDVRVIAVEEHFATQRFVDAVADLPVFAGESFEMDLMREVQQAGPIHERMIDLDTRLDDMDQAGTDVQVLSLNPPGVQPYHIDVAVGLVREQNDALAEMIRRTPDRLHGIGSVAPQDPRAAALEVERIMGSLGLGGVIICSHTQDRYLDDPAFEPLLEALAAQNATVYLHPRTPSPQMQRPYQDYGMQFALWGYQAEAGLHAVRLILSGALDRHPELRFVLGHLGEALPYWMTRLDNRYAYGLAMMPKGTVKLELTPSEYLKRNFAVTTSGMDDPEVLAFCLQRLGEDNIMFAADYPYEQTAGPARFLREADLTDSQRMKISHANAERLFRVPVWG